MRNVTHNLLLGTLLIGLLTPIHAIAQEQSQDGNDSVGAVFVMTNFAERNEVIAFKRAADGNLQEGSRFATGGRGSGGNTDPLESQGSLTLSHDYSLLFAVHAGSGEVSVFQVGRSTLSIVKSDGIRRERSPFAGPTCPVRTDRSSCVLFALGTAQSQPHTFICSL
jgi:6-phosphogluconolactonase